MPDPDGSALVTYTGGPALVSALAQMMREEGLLAIDEPPIEGESRGELKRKKVTKTKPARAGLELPLPKARRRGGALSRATWRRPHCPVRTRGGGRPEFEVRLCFVPAGMGRIQT